MAGPLNKLQTSFRSGTQLGRTSLEEVSARLGQPVRPTTPMGAAGIGVGPDSSKMAGSSANVAAAQRQALQPSEMDRLQDVLRQRTFQREETTEEKQKREQAAQMGGLTSLQTRVQELMDSYLNTVKVEAGASALPLITVASIQKIRPTLATTQAEKLAEILQDISANDPPTGKTVDQLYIDAYNILGITGTKDATKKTITDLIASSSTTIGEAAANKLDSALKLTEDSLTKMGTSSTELGQILSMEPSEVLNLTTEELQIRINNLRNEQYSVVESLRRTVADPNVGAAERQAAQDRLKELGYAGVTGTEAAVQRLTDEIEDANTVTVGGKTVSVSEALGDPFISGFIKSYIEGDAATRAEMEAKYGNLTAFINANMDALATLTSQLNTSVTDFFKLQDSARKIGDTAPGATLNDNVLGDWGLPTSTTTTFVSSLPAVPAVITYMRDPNNATVAQEMSQSLNRMGDISGDVGGVMTAIRDSSIEDLNAVGFTDNSDVYADYVQTIQSVSSAATEDAILDSIFGDTAAPTAQELQEIRNLQKAGFLTSSDLDTTLLDIIDANKDGKIDKPADIKAAFLNKLGKDGRPLTVKELLLAGKKVTDASVSPAKLLDSIKLIRDRAKGSDTSAEGSTLNRFRKFFTDGVFDQSDIDTLQTDNPSTEGFIQAAELLIKTGKPGTDSLRDAINTAADRRVNELFSVYPNLRASARDAAVSWVPESTEKWMSALISYNQLLTNGGHSDVVKNKLQQEYDAIKDKVAQAARAEYNTRKEKEEKKLGLPAALTDYNNKIAQMESFMATIGLTQADRGTPREQEVINEYRRKNGLASNAAINGYRQAQEAAIQAERIVEIKNETLNNRMASNPINADISRFSTFGISI